jgi:hypothetical protein
MSVAPTICVGRDGKLLCDQPTLTPCTAATCPLQLQFSPALQGASYFCGSLGIGPFISMTSNASKFRPWAPPTIVNGKVPSIRIHSTGGATSVGMVAGYDALVLHADEPVYDCRNDGTCLLQPDGTYKIRAGWVDCHPATDQGAACGFVAADAKLIDGALKFANPTLNDGNHASRDMNVSVHMTNVDTLANASCPLTPCAVSADCPAIHLTHMLDDVAAPDLAYVSIAAGDVTLTGACDVDHKVCIYT